MKIKGCSKNKNLAKKCKTLRNYQITTVETTDLKNNLCTFTSFIVFVFMIGFV